MIPTVVIAGVSSGVGKSTVTLGLLETLRRRGLTVQPFKVGPDFIDPGFHRLASGRPSRNLDAWMLPRSYCLASVARHAGDADLAVVEGVMGLFDGVEGKSDEGSTAQMAKWLDAPVILVVDAAKMARSGAAVVLGFERFDPDLRLAGVIFNRVAGEGHYRFLVEALAGITDVQPLGYLPGRDDLALPERHLGLVTARERSFSERFFERLALAFEATVEVDRLVSLAGSQVLPERGAPFSRPPVRVRIGVAMDDAFQFYYPDNLEKLEAAGAELAFWSPLRDWTLPEVDGLYLGGGYPELHAAELAANDSMRRAVREFAATGRPVYAECGGLIYLSEALESLDGRLYPMVGLIPTTVRMTQSHLTLRYVEVELGSETLLGPPGTVVRGHEFHYSRLDEPPASLRRAYRLHTPRGGGRQAEGYAVGSILASYVHLHFGSNPNVAQAFIHRALGSQA
ncbi:MAG: cobyrinate a,c-diamide synthase [Candidatus Methylomirabilia bacterium]